MAAAYTVAAPVAVFLLVVWLVVLHDHADRVVDRAVPLASVLVLVTPLLPLPVVLVAVVMVALVAVLVVRPPVAPA